MEQCAAGAGTWWIHREHCCMKEGEGPPLVWPAGALAAILSVEAHRCIAIQPG